MVNATRKGSLAAELHVRQHVLTSGVSARDGGGDEGPNPHELLESALAACTSLTVQMYANRKSWPLTAANVHVTITSESTAETHLERRVELVGDLTDEQRARLLEIANKCPIHRLLSGKITISTT